jgi:hypothetical protein
MMMPSSSRAFRRRLPTSSPAGKQGGFYRAVVVVSGTEQSFGARNEITIIVSSYDFDADKDISLYVKGTAPGKYAMAKAPAKSPAAAPAAAPTNVPKDD